MMSGSKLGLDSPDKGYVWPGTGVGEKAGFGLGLGRRKTIGPELRLQEDKIWPQTFLVHKLV